MKIRIKRFLTNPAPVGRIDRSRLGLLLATILVPVLLGVMACFELPVPVGDPEKSRIDPIVSGVWLGRWSVEEDRERHLLIFQPYDKRTWLVIWGGFEHVAGEEGSDVDSAVEELIELPGGGSDQKAQDLGLNPAMQESKEIRPGVFDDKEKESVPSLERLRNGEIQTQNNTLHKGWLTKIGDVRLITLQPIGVLDSERGMEPEEWWVLRVHTDDNDQMRLDFVDADFEGLGKAETRAQAERLIRRHIQNPDLFVEDGLFLSRVPQADYDLVKEMLSYSGIGYFD